MDKTRLLRFYLKAMSASKVHYNLLQHFISDLNTHISIFGANVAHPHHTCSTVYEHLVTIDAPETFIVSNKNRHKTYKNNTYKYNTKQGYTSGHTSSTISALDHLSDIMEDHNITTTFHNVNQNFDNNEDDSDSDCSSTLESYKLFISAFRRSSNIICNACGGRGHHAQKCFKRGRNFLPRDVQRRIAAYNAKYGDSPTSDTSPAPEKAYHALNPPDHRPPSNSPSSDTKKNDSPATPTISQLDHNIPKPTIEELLDQELGTANEPSIQTLEIHKDKLPLITHQSSLLHTIINNTGTVMPKYLTYYQETFLNKYTSNKYKQHRQALYHIDSGANVHATNLRSDFLVFHPTQQTINLAAGSKALCEGFGAILIKLNTKDPPIILAPVFYCPTAKVSTLSPGAIKVYNGYDDIYLRTHKALEYKKTPTSPQHSLPTTVYNNMDYLALSVIHIQHDPNAPTNQPMISNMEHQHNNNQYIHQQFDHRSMNMILEMKRKNLMEGLPCNLTKFHTNYH